MFNPKKIQNKQVEGFFKTLYVKKYSTVKKALKNGDLENESELILFQIDSEYLAFSKRLMAFHHIAEGTVNEKPYMLTFCVICNTGMVLNPCINGQVLHFFVVGVHNGMMLMADKETGTYWDHITGKGLSGKYENQQLEILQSHQILKVQEVLKHHPNCLYGATKLGFLQKLFNNFQVYKADIFGKGFLPPGFRKSMQKIDPRLPEMEMGLGVWADSKAKFYPTKLLKENGNFLFDQFNGRTILIYISPITHIPSLLYVNEKSSASFENNKLVFQNGDYLLGGNLYNSKDEKQDYNSPNHIYSRWYGFVSTFVNCEVGS